MLSDNTLTTYRSQTISYLSRLARQNSPALANILPDDPIVDIDSYSHPGKNFRLFGGVGRADIWGIVSLELDRREDTIMVDPETGRFMGLIDFSSTLCPLKDRDAALKKAKENTVGLGKLAHGAMINFDNAPADIKNLISRMEAGELEDFASVFDECEKLEKYLPK